MIEFVDIDKSGYLNAYESLLAYFGFFQNDNTIKTYQVNCSLCAPNIQLYYYPWNISQIDYYTKHASQIAFS